MAKRARPAQADQDDPSQDEPQNDPNRPAVSMGDLDPAPQGDEPNPEPAPVRQTATPDTRAIKVGDQEYTVPSAMADAFEAQSAAYAAQLEEVRGLVSKPAPQSVPKPDEPAEPDWEGMLFDDPGKFVKEFGESIRKGVMTEVSQAYAQDQGQRDLWNDFYTKNDDLKQFDWIVQASFSRHYSDLADMKTSVAMDELAKRARQDILAVAQSFSESSEGNRTPVTSGSAPPSKQPKKQAEPEDDKVVTLSDTLKARRAERRKQAAS